MNKKKLEDNRKMKDKDNFIKKDYSKNMKEREEKQKKIELNINKMKKEDKEIQNSLKRISKMLEQNKEHYQNKWNQEDKNN